MKDQRKTKHRPKNKKDLAVGKLIRKNAYIKRGNKKIKIKVSPSAVNEYILRIIDNIENNMPQIAESVSKQKRKTIM